MTFVHKKTGAAMAAPVYYYVVAICYLAITNCFVTLPPSVAMFMK